MRKLAGVILAVATATNANTVFAAPDPTYCAMISLIAKKIAEDRDRGVAYKAELGLLKGAAEEEPSMRATYKMAMGMAKVIYVDMPKITPEGAYKLHYVICMGAK